VLKLSATKSCTSDFPNIDYKDIPESNITYDYKNSMIALTNVDMKPDAAADVGGTGDLSENKVRTAADWKFVIVYTTNEHGLSKFCSVEEIKQKGSTEAAAKAAEAEKKAEL